MPKYIFIGKLWFQLRLQTQSPPTRGLDNPPGTSLELVVSSTIRLRARLIHAASNIRTRMNRHGHCRWRGLKSGLTRAAATDGRATGVASAAQSRRKVEFQQGASENFRVVIFFPPFGRH